MLILNIFLQQMSEKRPQPKYVKPVSLNELERRLAVDKVNFENSLMLHRIKNTPPVISKAQFEEDFKRHVEAEKVLRRRQMAPPSPPKAPKSPKSGSSLFDQATYTAQNETLSGPSATDLGLSSSPIKSMTEFRKHVISTKRMKHTNSAGSMTTEERNIGETNMSSIPDYNNSDAIFQLSHNPKK